VNVMGFEKDLGKALKLIRDLRLQAIAEDIDPRALRVALKVAIMIDDMNAMQFLTKDEEAELNQLATAIFKKTLNLSRNSGVNIAEAD